SAQAHLHPAARHTGRPAMTDRGRRAWGTLVMLATVPLLAWIDPRDDGAVALSMRDSAAYLVAAPAPLARPPSSTAGDLRVPSGGRLYDVRGAPSVSVAVIDQVLSAYDSPLAGQGQSLYDLGVRYGIDPAFCLAFFVHESAAGTRGEAALTHSLGNIRATA